MKKTYILLIFSVFILLIVSALLTRSLVNINIVEKEQKGDIPATAKDGAGTSSVSETKIEAKAAPSVQDITPGSWRAQPRNLKPETKFPEPPPSGSDEIGEITHARGNNYITPPGKNRSFVTVNSRIHLQSLLETGPKSYIQIRFNDGSTVSMAENSSLTVDEYIYDPKAAGNNCMLIRFLKGTCGVFTGAITELNPKRFTVRSRMASVGIRGCELAFVSNDMRDYVYILDVSDGKEVVVETTSNGSPTMNLLTGEDLDVDDSIRKTIVVAESDQMISLNKGLPPQQRAATPQEVREIQEQTSLKKPARYEMNHERGGVKFQLLGAPRK